jgi:hypothetical protein
MGLQINLQLFETPYSVHVLSFKFNQIWGFK